MCTVLKAFFYYLKNLARIEDYLIIESHSEYPYFISYKKLQSLIMQYVHINNQGLDNDTVDKYVKCICKLLSCNRFK